jgi:hypothetical protein
MSRNWQFTAHTRLRQSSTIRRGKLRQLRCRPLYGKKPMRQFCGCSRSGQTYRRAHCGSEQACAFKRRVSYKRNSRSAAAKAVAERRLSPQCPLIYGDACTCSATCVARIARKVCAVRRPRPRAAPTSRTRHDPSLFLQVLLREPPKCARSTQIFRYNRPIPPPFPRITAKNSRFYGCFTIFRAHLSHSQFWLKF